MLGGVGRPRSKIDPQVGWGDVSAGTPGRSFGRALPQRGLRGPRQGNARGGRGGVGLFFGEGTREEPWLAVFFSERVLPRFDRFLFCFCLRALEEQQQELLLQCCWRVTCLGPLGG